MRVATCLVMVFVVASIAQAEPYAVWETNGTIWGRDLATNDEWQLSRGANCHSPDLDGPIAVWVADWSYPADIMGAYLDGRFPVDFAMAVDPAIQSEPQVSWLNDRPYEILYVTWKQTGGIWGKRTGLNSSWYVELVPDYTGPYTLDGRTLAWDGGSLELSPELLPPPVPEPDVLSMLCLAALSMCLFHAFVIRRRAKR
jgi:hypothetical protein